MDLIPADYRRYIQQLQLLHRWGLFTLVIIAVSVSISLGLKYIASEYQKEIVVLEKKKAISSHQRGILQDLEKDRSLLTKKHQILEKLRGGALAEDMFVNIDRCAEWQEYMVQELEVHPCRQQDQRKAQRCEYRLLYRDTRG